MMRSHVSPLIVSGLFGRASMLDPFVKSSRVLCRRPTRTPRMLLGMDRSIRASSLLLWRQLGASITILLDASARAVWRLSAAIAVVFPVCRAHLATINRDWSSRSLSWYFVGVNFSLVLQNSIMFPTWNLVRLVCSSLLSFSNSVHSFAISRRTDPISYCPSPVCFDSLVCGCVGSASICNAAR